MYQSLIQAGRSRLVIGAVAVTSALFALLVFRLAPQRDYFGWNNVGLNISHQSSLQCNRLPGAEHVFLILKTGAHEALSRVPVHLDTTLRCVPRYAIYSDLADTVHGHPILDALDELHPDVYHKYPEFETYEALKRHRELGMTDFSHLVSAPEGMPKEEAPGWKLDKWKFLALVDKASRQEAQWYFFMETDTHVVWSNLLRWLSMLDPSQEWYLGGPSWFGDHVFAHGGTGIVLSRPTVLKTAQALRETPNFYEKFVADDCCGDSVLSTVLSHLNIPLSASWPMLQGETRSSLDYTEKHWCYPIVTQHHVTSSGIQAMWDFEQGWLANKDTTEQAIMHRDVFQHFLAPTVLKSETVQDWNNLSDDDEITKMTAEDREYGEIGSVAYTSLAACQESCKTKNECVQYSFLPGKCKLGHVIRLGGGVNEKWANSGMISGWMPDRIQEFTARMEPCSPNWILHS